MMDDARNEPNTKNSEFVVEPSEPVEVDVAPSASLDNQIVLEERLAAQIRRLIEQERRPPASVRTKQGAAISAMVVRFFSARPTVAAVGGLVAIVGVVIAYQANQKLQAQNELVEAQNGFFREQIQLMRAQNQFFREQIQQQAVQDYRARRAQLIGTLYDTRECRPDENPMKGRETCMTSSIEARTAAALSLVQMENSVRQDPHRWPELIVPDQTDLSSVDLRRAFLSEVDLQGVDLGSADLSGAILSGADLGSARLSNTNFDHAKLSRANLRSADLSLAKLRRADLSNADLSNANLHRADLSDADLSNADLSNADLHRSYLRNTHLSGADVGGSNLVTADVRRADMSGADLSHADFSNANLQDTKFEGAINLHTATFENARY